MTGAGTDVCYEDILPDGETAEENVSAAAAGENRLALAAAAAAAAAAAGP